MESSDHRQFNIYSVKEPDLLVYCFECIKMTSSAQSNFAYRIASTIEYSSLITIDNDHAWSIESKNTQKCFDTRKESLETKSKAECF